MSEADYQVEIRVRNGRILELMRKAGFSSVTALCRAMNAVTRQSVVGEIINLKKSPIGRDGQWLPLVSRMADALNATPDDLFTDTQRTSFMKSNRAICNVSEQEVAEFLERRTIDAIPPDEIVALKERASLVHQAVERLTSRERAVIVARFGLDGDDPKTYRDIGEKLGVHLERVRQLEHAAIRKMRASKANKPLEAMLHIEGAPA